MGHKDKATHPGQKPCMGWDENRSLRESERDAGLTFQPRHDTQLPIAAVNNNQSNISESALRTCFTAGRLPEADDLADLVFCRRGNRGTAWLANLRAV